MTRFSVACLLIAILLVGWLAYFWRSLRASPRRALKRRERRELQSQARRGEQASADEPAGS
jgi:hypothetical protein